MTKPKKNLLMTAVIVVGLVILIIFFSATKFHNHSAVVNYCLPAKSPISCDIRLLCSWHEGTCAFPGFDCGDVVELNGCFPRGYRK